MRAPWARRRSGLRLGHAGDERPDSDAANEACSWQVMRKVYEEQAARGVPEAVRGLERIDEGRWPSSGRRRDGQDAAPPGQDAAPPTPDAAPPLEGAALPTQEAELPTQDSAPPARTGSVGASSADVLASRRQDRRRDL